MPQYLDKKEIRLMKKEKSFSYKEKGYTTYDYLGKE